MKRILLPTLAALLTLQSQAQQNPRMYAVTGKEPGQTVWTSLRQVNQSGEPNRLLMDAAATTNFVQQKGAIKATPQLSNGASDAMAALPGVAALAYDARHHRLYFAPLFREGGIRFIDLGGKDPSVVYTLDNQYNLLDRKKDGEAKNITRMVIGKDGNGYAISNDGNSFMRFSTGKDGLVENLGMLVDAETNGSISVHNACSGWGGDIVAAQSGDLYLFTVRQQVFRIDPSTRIATFLGALKNAPAEFTVNGAAVDEKGRVVLASSVAAGKRLVVEDMISLEARLVEDATAYNASDLASANLLFAPASTAVAALPAVMPYADNRNITVHPNPVTNNQVLVSFNQVKKGRYQLDMVGSNGAVSQSHRVDVQQNGQTHMIRTNNMSRGFYVLRVTNGSGEVFSEKLLLK